MAGPADVLTRVLTADTVPPDWFTEEFRAEVPIAEVQRLRDAIIADHGTLEAVTVDGTRGTVRLSRALFPVSIVLDGEGRIAGLQLGPPEPLGSDPDALAARLLAATPGAASLYVAVGDDVVVAKDADRPMAVASAFKLVVLSAYEAAIADGRLTRENVVRLTKGDRSLPSGVLQTLPPQTPVTLETLATLMIHISDNTATDALMRVVGRDAVLAVPHAPRPLLSTAEYFKLRANADTRAAFDAADEAGRADILAALTAEDLPTPTALPTVATPFDGAWAMSTRALCETLLSLHGAPALDGPYADRLVGTDWRWTGYKGGSDVGTLNLTAAGERLDGTRVCASFTVNAETGLDGGRLSLLFGALFGSLRE
ncbi:MAG: serine hydrolase [Pseudomonadota bacterium]